MLTWIYDEEAKTCKVQKLTFVCTVEDDCQARLSTLCPPVSGCLDVGTLLRQLSLLGGYIAAHPSPLLATTRHPIETWVMVFFDVQPD